MKEEAGSKGRSEGERDRDRVLYSSALRRLAGITQVVSAHEGYTFHNRLTHSLETAQVARRIAQYLKEIKGNDIEKYGKTDPGYLVDPDIVEAGALAHDLGHPPFGHIAEQELDAAIRKKNDRDGFEGNAQSFRIVTKLSIRRDDFRGLNLTPAALNTMLKYPWPHSAIPPNNKKWGYYSTEKEHFDFARASFAKEDRDKKTVEAEIMDWADDIAYSVHDVEDFFRAGMIPLDELSLDGTHVARFVEEVFDRRKQEDDPLLAGDIPIEKDEAKEILEKFFGLAKRLGLRKPYQGTRADRAVLRAFTSELIGHYIRGTPLKDGEPKVQTIDLLPPDSPTRVQIKQEAKREVLLSKELVIHYVFNNPSLVGQQYGQRRLIRELFEIFHEAAGGDAQRQAILPVAHREYLNELGNSKSKHERETARVRVVGDVISSLTEQQAIALYKRFTGYDVGTVFDPIVR